MQGATAAEPFGKLHVEGDRAARPVGGKHRRCRAECIGPHPPPPNWRSDFVYSAIWRLISLESRPERSQVYFIAPRSMTAKLSPSSQAKSRYCSTSTMAMLPRLRK